MEQPSINKKHLTNKEGQHKIDDKVEEKDHLEWLSLK